MKTPALALLLTALALPAYAQNNFPTPGGATAMGTVSLCLNAQGIAVPTDQNGACPGGGTGGGLSVTDAAAWTTASSKFTPTGGVYNPSATALVSGQQGTVSLNSSRAMYVDIQSSGSNLLTALTNPPQASTPTASGGLTTYFVQPTASTNAAIIKGTPGQVYWILAMNNSATVNYLRFYNTTSGPTCSSATGLVTQIQIPASTSVGGVSIPLPFGLAFAAGIGICVTSGYATTDATNATATAISLTIGYN